LRWLSSNGPGVAMVKHDDTFHVGVVNFAPVYRDKAATLDKIEASIVEAAAQGIDLLASRRKSGG
jgi:hypothetical protein